MSPITHFLLGWSVANVGDLTRRERAAVTLAGVIPDVDGLGIVVDLATRSSAHPTDLYGTYHHVLAHNLLGSMIVLGACLLMAHKRLLTASLAVLSYHLHLLGDLLGSRGPNGEQWEIFYLWPFSRAAAWRTDWQWELNAWPNFVVTLAALLLAFYLAWRRGFSPLELVSRRADIALVKTLRQRFGEAA